MARVRGDRDLDLAARVERLTAGQRACLDLVDGHATSKEIALRLGISRHTVDARLRQAMQILDVGSRREAAMIWRAASGADGYQPFVYQPPQVEAGGADGDIMGHEPALRISGSDGEPGGRALVEGALSAGGEVADAVAWSFASFDGARPRESSPTLRLWGGANDLTPAQRIAGILIVTIMAMLAFGLLLSGISALTQLRT